MEHTTIVPPAPLSEQVDELESSFRRDGFVVLDQVLSADDVDLLRAETVRICRGERGPIDGAPPIDAAASDDDVVRRYLCVHFPHKLSALVFDTMRHPRVVGPLTRIVGPNVKAMQSMLFVKAPGRPGQAWHQDEMFIPTRDRSLTAAWIALDDATTRNGCLWVLPGSHRSGVIYPNRDHDDPRFDRTVESYDFPYDESDAVPVELKAGSVLLFNGYLLHRSLPNLATSGYRRALVCHYMRAESLLPWTPPADGVAMAQADCRDIVLVAGSDPYAYRGIEEVRRPRVRHDRDEGGDR